MKDRGQVLVAIINNLRDWQFAREDHWYRIPIHSAPSRWPPDWIAFYQTKIFAQEAHAVNYIAQVRSVRTRTRAQLLPDEPLNPRSKNRYFQLMLGQLERLPKPIPSRRLRRIVFIPTTLRKIGGAEEINDLFDDSPLEDALWEELKTLSIPAERQFFVEHGKGWYSLDFALFCRKGKLDIETDGDSWHADAKRVAEDNERNNTLAADGWQVLRFNTMQVREKLADYCVPQIIKTVNRMGGIDEEWRDYKLTPGSIMQQLSLFERRSPYGTDEEPDL